jgi:hypothetical protein
VNVRTAVHRAAPFVVAALIVGTIIGVASGVETIETDPNDTRGSLDIRRVHYAWVPGAVPTWEVRTREAWTAHLLWDRGYTFVEFDTRGDERADFYVLVYSDGRRMRGAMFEILPARDRRIRSLAVGRPNRSTAVVGFGWSSLEFGPHRTTFRWWVTTSFSGDGCRRSCVDVAPDDGGIEEWRPGFSPTPTPTTSTPAPTTTQPGSTTTGPTPTA